MIITSKELIEEYYNQEERFSSIPLEEFKLACKAQFELVKKEMINGKLRDIRLKYFGNFVVYPGRVKHLNERLDKQKEEGTISDQDFDKFKSMYKDYELERQKD